MGKALVISAFDRRRFTPSPALATIFPMPPIIRLDNLRKSYGALVAVDGVSLTVERGEIFGLLGPNGAGKTTIVNMIVGLLRPDEGVVDIDGAGAPTDPAVRARIGVAPQALALYEEMSGLENVTFFARLQGLRGGELKRRVAWALDFVGLTDRARSRAGTYSGGMKRRLNIAIALVHEPPLLLLDEPTVGVDPQSRNAIFERINELKDRGGSIVYTTHYMEEAQRLCDRVAIVDHGKILALDTVDALIAAHGGKSVLIVQQGGEELRIDTANPLGELARLDRESSLSSFRVERPDLETVFLNLTGRRLRD